MVHILKYIMQLKKDVYFLGTCISEKSWVLCLAVYTAGEVTSKGETVIYFISVHRKLSSEQYLVFPLKGTAIP